MSPIPSLETRLLAARSNELLMRGLAEAGAHAHMLMKREVSHFTVETIAVTIAIFVLMGLLYYWGIKKEGSWK
ncbi:hypothetical protein MAPG_09836 [Magnaporthiopsis poae ATCC 64411]|uniref:Uncharacterized protein n=1 Tax=Magnaporthiopsis poae (strain ATCC 64411 / 73-15) TaxID=644358 RepID=A0A0C4EAZ6_MAGP6|nr:hypothetical protein MAPG_09836 [Magnaporthiopsis poae ATCC 64411]